MSVALRSARHVAPVCFTPNFDARFLRGLFILPMMATRSPSRVGHDFHPNSASQTTCYRWSACAAALVFHPRRSFLHWFWSNLAMDAAGDADRARGLAAIPSELNESQR